LKNSNRKTTTTEDRRPLKQKLLLLSLVAVIGLIVFLTGKVMPRYSSVILLLVFMACYTWLITLAMVHQQRRELKRPKPVNADYRPRVSIVIAAHNEEMVIEDTVRRLMRLDYPDYEVLVMDDRSTDDTAAILERLAMEYPPHPNPPPPGGRGLISGSTIINPLPLRGVLFEENPLPPGGGGLGWGGLRYHTRSGDDPPGKPSALNQALALTDGEVIAVFDADACVEPDFLSRIIPFLADENVGAVQARKVIANWDENWLTRCQHYEYCLDAHFQYGRDSVRGAVELRGNGQLVKREALAEVEGWNPHTLTDDLDLSTRLHIAGWDIRFAHKVRVYEEGITRFGALLKQRRRWTEGTLFRYLEYAGPLVCSRKASIRTTLDMVAYFLEFLLPLWLVMDFAQLACRLLVGDTAPTLIISSFLVVPVFCVSMSIALVVAIIRFNRPKVGHALLWGIITGLYMTILWFPLVFGIMVKVLFQPKRRTRWDKTDHTGAGRRPLAVPSVEISEPAL
jgi:1,2-diacylglycerol 3-beta-glucosyltransferase